MADALRDVAVCVDASEQSEHAWRWTVALLESASDSPAPCVRLVSVAVAAPLDLWTPDEESPWLVATASSEEDRTRKAEEARAVDVAQARVQDLLDRHPPPQHVSVTTLTPLVCGTIGETIIASLKTHPPGLCVCSARGMGSLRRLVVGLADTLLRGLGSVSDHMVHNAPWPVVVVKPQ
jgi:nucleotide-binding universal stress UspA family protein